MAKCVCGYAFFEQPTPEQHAKECPISVLRNELEQALLQNEELRSGLELAVEILGGGRLCSIGSWQNTREVQVHVDTITKLRAILTWTAKPLCQHELRRFNVTEQNASGLAGVCAKCGQGLGGNPKAECGCSDPVSAHGLLGCPNYSVKPEGQGGCPDCGEGVTGKDPLCVKHYGEYLGQNRARGNGPGD